MSWIILGIVLGSLFALYYTVDLIWQTSRRRNYYAQAAFLDARRQVDAIYKDAGRQMEEAAGVRRPGEEGMGDDLGSWEDW